MSASPTADAEPSSGVTVRATGRSAFRSTVALNTPLCREHYRLVLKLPTFAATEPGQFVQVSCRDDDDHAGAVAPEGDVDWVPRQAPCLRGPELVGPVAFLRRPFSLAGRRDSAGGVELELIHRVIGVGTDWLSRLRPGDTVGVLGPLGNRFELPPTDAPALLVGGGVGIPPMLYLAEALKGRPAVAFAGATTKDLLPLTLNGPAAAESADAVEPRMVVREFARHGIPSVVSTDDGSVCFRGFVTQALERYLDRTHRPGGSHRPVVYTCGPEPMMKRVAEMAASRGLECQVAVERAMACGMGTCQSCCIRLRKPDPSKPPLVGRDWCYRLACTDGPIFRGADLLW